MRGKLVLGLSVGLLFSVVASATTSNAFTGQTTRVSVSSSGEPANLNGLRSGGFSANGRYVVFSATASNLGASGQQVYRRECASRDCTTGTTEVVSVTPAGAASSGFSPSVSANGQFVAFVSFSSDLVAGVEDTNGMADVFLRDMRSRSTKLVSAITTGGTVKAVGGTLLSTPDAHVVTDGGLVAFVSASPDLASDLNKNNPHTQIYVRNMTTVGVAVAASERDRVAGDGPSSHPALSADGRWVAFTSFATNLTEDVFRTPSSQIYVRDLEQRGISLESVTWDGLAVSGAVSSVPTLSGNGRFLAFESMAQLDSRSDLDVDTWDVYLRDRTMRTTVHVSHSTTPTFFPRLHSQSASVSADGKFVAFHSSDLGLVAGDTNATGVDVFLYDQATGLLSIVSRNDEGAQANMPAREPSLSGDGTLVVFASSATNLVADPFTTNLQLYLRDLGAPNVAPTVNLRSSLDLTFTLTLDTSGTFTDPGPAPDETHTATVNYGDGSDTLELALDDGSFALQHTYAHAGGYTVTVIVSDSNGGSTTATMAVNVRDYSYEWLDPVGTTFVVGRNLPVKFRVFGPDGSPVLDQSVRVDVVNTSGAVVAGPFVFGDQPSRSVTWSSGTYHVNVDTRDLAQGMYWLRVRFSSSTITGEFTLATNGIATLSSRSGLR